MKTKAYDIDTLIPAILSIVLAFSLTACSDDEKPQEDQATVEQQAPKASAPTFDHPHGPEVTDMQKHQFEHDFAAQCVDRELNNSANKIEDAERLTKSCECIAAYMMKDLTVQEAEKFIGEKEHPQSLRIKFEAAAYECLQDDAKIAGPKLFGRQP
jgi:hypothetical protein